MNCGPTISPGQDREVDWRTGLEDAIFLCTGRITTDAPPASSCMAATLPGPSCMVPTLISQPPGPGSALRLAESPIRPCSLHIRQEPYLDSTSMDNSTVQQHVRNNAAKVPGDCGALASMSETERQHESRVGFVQPQKSTFSACESGAQTKKRRKVGRPVMHTGDPDDPALTERERRRMKRRVANRESARRVRSRRQEEMEEMQAKMDELLEKGQELRRRAEDSLQQRNQLAQEVEAMRCQLSDLTAQNQKMEAEVHALRQSLQVRMCALESELDKRDAEASAAPSSPFETTIVHRPPGAAVPAAPLIPSSMPMEKQGSGCMSLFLSLDLDRMNHEALPSVDLDCLLDPSSLDKCVE